MDTKYIINTVYETNIFLDRLRKDSEPSYYPVKQGLTKYGRKINLGFTCYGIKLKSLTGEWSNFSQSQKDIFINYLKSFQNSSSNFPENYFIDEELLKSYNDPFTYQNLKFNIKKIVSNFSSKTFQTKELLVSQSINAENKQTISTFYEIGHKNIFKSNNEYSEDGMIKSYLDSLDWNRPWSAGAQFSSLCVYSQTQGFNYDDELIDFIYEKLNKDTGSFHNPQVTNSREIINGAMKVITGLDWIDHEIPLPNKLIDFCIDNMPVLEGCDVVDFIYVLYKCSNQNQYRIKEVNEILENLVDEIMMLFHINDKGFSYFKNKSQNYYYGTNISKGLDTADIHGTLLCTWGLNMILDHFNKLEKNMKVIKP